MHSMGLIIIEMFIELSIKIIEHENGAWKSDLIYF